MTKNNKNNNETQQYLKRLQQESSQQKKEQALNILRREPPKVSSFFKWFQPWQQQIVKGYEFRKRQLIKQIKYSENRHLFIITVFFTGAIYVSWKIEEKYDRIRNRAKNTKSFKKRQVEAENQYIQKMLSRNPFEPVPIQEEEKDEEDYIYQKAHIEFDTKADLLQIMEREKGLMEEQQIQRL